MSHVAIRLTLTGRVQGLGVRPAIARWARKLSLTGWVGNTCQGVEVVAEGLVAQVERFARELLEQLPQAAVVKTQVCATVVPSQSVSFEIRRQSASGKLKTQVPEDLAVCAECLGETLRDSGRRSGYAFTSCTLCGPRFSIIEVLPYERDGTTMQRFALCPNCQWEYNCPDDRRFHAETNACAVCGPSWWCRDNRGQIVATRAAAIAVAAAVIGRGEIVALQGIGGYQLIVDATSEVAVSRLRNRKQRFGKPFAIMVESVEHAHRLAWCDDLECRTLASPAGPIVVLEKKKANDLAPAVSPGLDTIGLMLPTTPLHALLLAACRRPLVVTSGNCDGAPLEFEHDGAQRRLANIADLWLEHDRVIQRPVDDSVVHVLAGRMAVLRLARGYAPLSLEIRSPAPLLAVGGHHKAAVALSNGEQAVLGPHVGDLDTVAECERWESQIAGLRSLYGSSPDVLVGDQHPDYASTRWAAEQPQPWVAVQHHHAHVAAGMVEQGWLDRTVLGVAFDGTGLGDDGTIWGGEFLLTSPAGYQRVGHLLPFELPGGDRAVREPWRVAVSLVQRAAGTERARSLSFQSGTPSSLFPLLGKRRFSPATTSAGRLFDGVAALALDVELAQFEGQGPMLLEAIVDRSSVGCYSLEVTDTEPFVLDWRSLVRQLLQDRRAAAPPGAMAMRFHRGLANAIVEAACRFPQLPVVLCGGCFQNRLLVELVLEQLDEAGLRVGTPGLIPVNDGGLAAGQLAVVAAQLAQQRGW